MRPQLAISSRRLVRQLDLPQFSFSNVIVGEGDGAGQLASVNHPTGTLVATAAFDIAAMPGGLWWDDANGDLWHWGKNTSRVLQLDGFTCSVVLNTYDFSTNVDVNSLNAFMGGVVDLAAQRIYCGDFVTKKIIRGTAAFGVATDVVVDITVVVNTCTGFAFLPNGDMIVLDHTNYLAKRLQGFSNVVLDTQIGLGAGNERPWGVTVGPLGEVLYLISHGGAAGNNGRYLVYNGFNGSLMANVAAVAGWNKNQGGITVVPV